MVSAMSARWLCLVLLASLAACSSEKTSPEPPNPLATSDGFCHQFGVSACSDAAVTACSGVATATESLRSACQLKQELFCNQTLPTGYAPTHAQACIDAVTTAYADGKLTSSEARTVRDFAAPCDRLIKGPIADGGSCTQDIQCDTVSGSICIPKGTSGMCGLPTEVGAGTSCAGANAVCGKGFYCDSGMHCVARQTEGQTCSASGECTEGLVCTSGMCATKTDPSMCMHDTDCVDTTVCLLATGASTGSCVEQIVLSPTTLACQDLK